MGLHPALDRLPDGRLAHPRRTRPPSHHQTAIGAIMRTWAKLHGWPIVETGRRHTVRRRLIDLVGQMLTGATVDEGSEPPSSCESCHA